MLLFLLDWILVWLLKHRAAVWIQRIKENKTGEPSGGEGENKAQTILYFSGSDVVGGYSLGTCPDYTQQKMASEASLWAFSVTPTYEIISVVCFAGIEANTYPFTAAGSTSRGVAVKTIMVSCQVTINRMVSFDFFLSRGFVTWNNLCLPVQTRLSFCVEAQCVWACLFVMQRICECSHACPHSVVTGFSLSELLSSSPVWASSRVSLSCQPASYRHARMLLRPSK